MAAKKSAKYPYKWSNGTWHSRPEKKDIKNVTLKNAPPGTYDIGLDIQERAGERGLRQLLEDTDTQGTYAVSDYNLGLERLGQDITGAREGVERDYGRTLQDLLAQQQGVERSYQRLGGAQAQAGRAAGLQAGGFAEQAARKRAVNQDIDLAPIGVARTRAGEDRQLNLDDLLRQQRRGTQDLSLPYTRGVEERATQVQRAKDEQRIYGSDLDKIRMQQYTQGGGLIKRKFNLAKPKQRKQYKRFKRLGVI